MHPSEIRKASLEFEMQARSIATNAFEVAVRPNASKKERAQAAAAVKIIDLAVRESRFIRFDTGLLRAKCLIDKELTAGAPERIKRRARASAHSKTCDLTALAKAELEWAAVMVRWSFEMLIEKLLAENALDVWTAATKRLTDDTDAQRVIP